VAADFARLYTNDSEKDDSYFETWRPGKVDDHLGGDCSLVRCKEAFALLMLTQKTAVNDVVRSKGQGTKAFRDCFGYAKVETFWSDLIVFFDVVISIVEYSLIMQGV
jgi:hypothetical protein